MGRGLIECTVAGIGKNWYLAGTNSDGSLYIQIKIQGLTDEQFAEYIERSYSNPNLLVYPQIRKNLFVLPSNTTTQRTFLYYYLSQVDPSYATSKANAEWAVQMVGHWYSHGHFVQDNGEIYVGTFDLDYDFTAARNQELFTAERAAKEIDAKNHSHDLNGIEGWYLQTSVSREISFSAKSYSVSVDSAISSSIQEDQLHDFALDLNIWDK